MSAAQSHCKSAAGIACCAAVAAAVSLCAGPGPRCRGAR